MTTFEEAKAKLDRELRDCEQRAKDAKAAIPDYAKVIHRAQPIGSTELRFSDAP